MGRVGMDMEDFFCQVLDIMNGFLHRYGTWGLGLSMFAESMGIPFSSAYFVATAWTVYSRGRLSLAGIIALSTLGITLGSACSYGLGFYSRKLGRIIRFQVRHRDKDREAGQGEDYELAIFNKFSKALDFMHRYGYLSVFLAQLFGLTRTFISFPAGYMQFHFWRFLWLTAVGGALFSLFAVLGSMLLTTAIIYLTAYAFLLPWLTWLTLALPMGAALYIVWKKFLSR